jgi:hypothetical protein
VQKPQSAAESKRRQAKELRDEWALGRRLTFRLWLRCLQLMHIQLLDIIIGAVSGPGAGVLSAGGAIVWRCRVGAPKIAFG